VIDVVFMLVLTEARVWGSAILMILILMLGIKGLKGLFMIIINFKKGGIHLHVKNLSGIVFAYARIVPDKFLTLEYYVKN
jgi:hypothetical protein